MAGVDDIPTELFLLGYPRGIREQADRLRALVRLVVPDAPERVRLGWRLIGYDLPIGRRSRYFAWIALEPKHVHLGFQYGVWMADPDGVLRGAHLRLRKVRYLTFQPGQRIPRSQVLKLIREAVTVTELSPAERTARALDIGWDAALAEPRP